MLVDAVVAEPRLTNFALRHIDAGATMHRFALDALYAAILVVRLLAILAGPLIADSAALKLVLMINPFAVDALARRPVQVPQHVAQVTDDFVLVARKSPNHFNCRAFRSLIMLESKHIIIKSKTCKISFSIKIYIYKMNFYLSNLLCI